MKSKINLELKHFCKDFKPIRKILKNVGARKITTKKQKDYFFNLPQIKDKNVAPRLKFRIDDTYALIFYKRNKFSPRGHTPSSISLLFLKDAKLIPFLKRALGVRTIVEKKRELWKKGNTVFHLDTIKGVGNIFEIEVWTSPKTIQKDHLKFTEYRKKLIPHLSRVVLDSNEDLISKLRK